MMRSQAAGSVEPHGLFFLLAWQFSLARPTIWHTLDGADERSLDPVTNARGKVVTFVSVVSFRLRPRVEAQAETEDETTVFLSSIPSPREQLRKTVAAKVNRLACPVHLVRERKIWPLQLQSRQG